VVPLSAAKKPPSLQCCNLYLKPREAQQFSSTWTSTSSLSVVSSWCFISIKFFRILRHNSRLNLIRVLKHLQHLLCQIFFKHKNICNP
ncbi:hypothetical protein GIB67_041646, partial [Kingdonia uniflora]